MFPGEWQSIAFMFVGVAALLGGFSDSSTGPFVDITFVFSCMLVLLLLLLLHWLVLLFPLSPPPPFISLFPTLLTFLFFTFIPSREFQ